MYLGMHIQTHTYINIEFNNNNNKIDYPFDSIGAWEWVVRRQLKIDQEQKEGKGEQKVMQFFVS